MAVSGHADTPSTGRPVTTGSATPYTTPVDVNDVDTVLSYTQEEQLDGGWLPEIPLVSAEQAVRDWRAGWAGRAHRNGPTLVATVVGEQRFIGIVSFTDRGNGAVEMIYGIAPRWRGLGLATRAARLGAQWALGLPGVTTVELQIDQDMSASQQAAAGNLGPE